jgi:hypothetical protein
MPFVFQSGDFAPQQASPMQQLLGSLFGTAAQEFPRAFENAQEDARFQKQLKLQMDKFDWEKHQAELQQQEQQRARDSMASLIAPQAPMSPGDKASDQRSAAGIPQAFGTGGVGGMMRATGEYMQKHGQRLAAYRQLFAGLEPQHQAALLGVLKQQEEQHKQDAFRKDLAEMMGQEMRGMQMRSGPDLQGPTQSGQALGEDPQLTQQRQLFGQQTALWQQMLQNGEGNPEQIMQHWSQGQAALKQMEVAHQRAMAQHAMYSQLHQETGNRLQELLAMESMSPGSVEPSYLYHLQDRYNQEEGLLGDRMGNLDMPQEDFAKRWSDTNRSWWGKVMSETGNKDTDRAVKHIQSQISMLSDEEKRITDRVSNGLMDPEQAKPLLEALDQKRAIFSEAMNAAVEGDQGSGQPTGGGGQRPDPQAMLEQATQEVAKAIAFGEASGPAEAANKLGLPEELKRAIDDTKVREAVVAIQSKLPNTPEAQVAKEGAGAKAEESIKNIADLEKRFDAAMNQPKTLGGKPVMSDTVQVPKTEDEFRRAYVRLSQLAQKAKARGEHDYSMTGMVGAGPGTFLAGDKRREYDRLDGALKLLVRLGTLRGWARPTLRQQAEAVNE